ncbi:MAG: hypothetical protein IPN17_32025 [Deltaproteobacteria bacterium]|nr:hypothetical protein [Deltaproteobacteria bacterium]
MASRGAPPAAAARASMASSCDGVMFSVSMGTKVSERPAVTTSAPSSRRTRAMRSRPTAECWWTSTRRPRSPPGAKLH